MLAIYRRHRRRCNHQDEGRSYRRCQCPIWMDGTLAGKDIRKSLGLRDWERAQDLIRKLEAEGDDNLKPSQPPQLTLQEAWDRFVADLEARKLHPETVAKYRLLSRQMRGFADEQGLHFLRQFDVATLGNFRAGWRDGALSALKKLERLRAFLRFCEQRKWIDDNPATHLKAPKIQNKPTMPFTREEMIHVLQALDQYPDKWGRLGQANARRLRAFVLLLRYSGMRIGDTVSCQRDCLSGNKLLLYTQKTGVPVYAVLPDFVVRALEATSSSNEMYFFWSGVGKLRSAIGSWQRSLMALFRLAGVAKGHAHRLRDTFAVELLLASTPIEEVSVLLGHHSIKITERHYSPWVVARQRQLEAHLERAWSQDPIVLLQGKGTQEVHGKKEAVN